MSGGLPLMKHCRWCVPTVQPQLPLCNPTSSQLHFMCWVLLFVCMPNLLFDLYVAKTERHITTWFHVNTYSQSQITNQPACLCTVEVSHGAHGNLYMLYLSAAGNLESAGCFWNLFHHFFLKILLSGIKNVTSELLFYCSWQQMQSGCWNIISNHFGAL